MKRIITLGLALATSFVMWGTTAPKAEAARQTTFWHMGNSQRATLLTFHDWRCKNGHATDFVARGHTAEISVGSVWIPKGYSLWVWGADGTRGYQFSKAKSDSYCATMAVRPSHKFLAVLRKGNW